MAAKGGHIDFMFLGPPYPAAGSFTEPYQQNTLGPAENEVSQKEYSVKQTDILVLKSLRIMFKNLVTNE